MVYHFRDSNTTTWQLFCVSVLQYGYVVFFVAAFPLAPFFAFLNNIAEIRIDAKNCLCKHRRPVPKRVSGIGAWNGIMQSLTYISIITNVRFFKMLLSKLIYIWFQTCYEFSCTPSYM